MSENLDNTDNMLLGKLVKNITVDEINKGIEMAEECLKWSRVLVTEITEGTELTNLRISKNIERVLRQIKRHPGITHSGLLRNTKIVAREMDEIISTLLQRKEIEWKIIGTGAKKGKAYRPLQEELDNEIKGGKENDKPTERKGKGKG